MNSKDDGKVGDIKSKSNKEGSGGGSSGPSFNELSHVGTVLSKQVSEDKNSILKFSLPNNTETVLYSKEQTRSHSKERTLSKNSTIMKHGSITE